MFKFTTRSTQKGDDAKTIYMEKARFTITIHMVSSLDGIIARKDNSISWFETSSKYDKGVDGENPEEFLKTIDCYVMGSNTFELAEALAKDYGWAYGDKPTFVLTNRNLNTHRQNIQFYGGEILKLVNEQLKPKYKNVWIVGGSVTAREFIKLKLADEIRVSILPIILGEGMPYFNEISQEQALHLKDAKAYKNGMVELCYGVIK